ncbi:hypothetical protein JCM10908_000982 [Rhodotorula pacifica]|uniref:cytochrome oxidase assembly protein SHY1 n=1 Tax=Rhodotorula pacifica TaxID=1495444 RepID=UPI00316C500C
MFGTAARTTMRSAPRARCSLPPTPWCIASRTTLANKPLPNPLRFPYARHASTSSSSGGSQTTRDKLRARPFLILVGVMPVFTFILGAWQIKRLQWKVDLIDQLDQKLHQPPVRLPAKIDTSAIPEYAWRKVYVTGELDHEHSIELGPKTRDGQLGYHVFTPLKRGEGQDTILVNRGFVKREFRDPKERPASLTSGPVSLVGMLRSQEARNSFTPVNQPEKGEWVFTDIEELARYTGSEPVLVDQIYDDNPGKVELYLRDGVPVGRNASIELRNMHATYAATWFTLSAFTGFMFFRLMRRPSVVTSSQYRKLKDL